MIWPSGRCRASHLRCTTSTIWSGQPRSSKLDSIINHMGNFFDCVKSRRKPISDVESQHRSATTCHLGNIAMWVGRPLRWDPKVEEFLDDSLANSHLRRPQRPGFEVV